MRRSASPRTEQGFNKVRCLLAPPESQRYGRQAQRQRLASTEPVPPGTGDRVGTTDNTMRRMLQRSWYLAASETRATTLSTAFINAGASRHPETQARQRRSLANSGWRARPAQRASTPKCVRCSTMLSCGCACSIPSAACAMPSRAIRSTPSSTRSQPSRPNSNAARYPKALMLGTPARHRTQHPSCARGRRDHAESAAPARRST